ncbi:hypothetical protein EF910_32085 [Streptomyces sp. WAC07149]|uniref:hypothetical protein n=1 Tax=Streptomyces sp. WAC07149 TaxID=2487425 RepID=UPI000F78D93E|nr:hypothetical protein [Streptomyces sp. WAC07149]RST00376.1 hypothetical protein EF910_32085 [Streptomyces sp. WAC07149]
MPHPGENPDYTRPDDPRLGDKGPGGKWDLRVNPAIDPRLDSFPALQDDTYGQRYLHRGFLKTAVSKEPGDPSSPANTPYLLRFLYNPSSIKVTHKIDPNNMLLPGNYTPPEDTSTAVGATGGSLSLNLRFDRTYETSDPSKQNTFVGDMGVLADAHVLYNMVGMNAVAHSESPDKTNKSFADPDNVLGVMQMTYVWMTLMDPRDGSTYRSLPNHSRMNYFGYITGIELLYSHFTQRMAPSRAEFGIDLQLMTSFGYAR